MTTKAELRLGMRKLLTDATAFPDSQVDEWTKQAVYDYSLHFPYPRTATWHTVAGTRSYVVYAEAAVTIVHGVLGVEYPTGNEPPTMLRRKDERQADFYGGAYYDLRLEGYSLTLVLGQTPSNASDSIGFTYLSEHTYPSLESTTLTIPEKHLELVRLFVHWKALSSLELSEEMDVQRKADVLHALGFNALRAEQVYRERIQQVLQESAPGGWTGGWKMDSKDRIY